MLILALFSIVGITAGLLLLRSAPLLPAESAQHLAGAAISLIIPARNEETNLPPLLHSLRSAKQPPLEVIVVDDHSSDATAAIGRDCGATVIASAPLPPGWTGKTWACHQGALAATGDILLFLDADCFFTWNGYDRIAAYAATLPRISAISILPFHRTKDWHEELCLFFNILVAMGAGGFGKLDHPHCFGQSLMIHRNFYLHIGGHESVKHEILENLHLATHLRARGGVSVAVAGGEVLQMRMFPHGFSQLRESWTKAFAAGADATSRPVFALAILWLAAAAATFVCLVVHPSRISFILYLLNAVQIFWYGRQLGTFRLATALLYPVPLTFYFAIFAQSLTSRLRREPVAWRGRRL